MEDIPYPSEFLAVTHGFSCAEHGANMLLLHAYADQGPLKNDIDRLSRIAAGAPEQTVRYVLDKFWIFTDEGWVNPILDAHIRHNEEDG